MADSKWSDKRRKWSAVTGNPATLADEAIIATSEKLRRTFHGRAVLLFDARGASTMPAHDQRRVLL
jgi:hypothetical protein